MRLLVFKKLGLAGSPSQRGDTLVEVVMAIAILAMVLVASFNVASSAFRLGQSAKERTQASNLIQEQSEALRNYRDTHKWSKPAPVNDDMLDNISFGPKFHMVKVPTGGSYRWDFASGALQSGIHRVYIVATPSPPPDGTDKIRFDITAEWVPAGGSGANNVCPGGFVGNCTTISTYLVNLDDYAPTTP